MTEAGDFTTVAHIVLKANIDHTLSQIHISVRTHTHWPAVEPYVVNDRSKATQKLSIVEVCEAGIVEWMTFGT